MRSYRRIRLGVGGEFGEQCFAGGFAGLDYDIDEDLTGKFEHNWQAFNAKFIPVWLESNPGKSRVAAGLSCGALWSFGMGVKSGDILLAPDVDGMFHVGTVDGGYIYEEGGPLPHRRSVSWSTDLLDKDLFSEQLRRSIRGPLSFVDISKYSAQLDPLIAGKQPPTITVADESVEDPIAFALESHLEDFLVANWEHTPLATSFDLYSVDGVMVGQQFPTDTGPIDLLAIHKDGSVLLVVELKRGRASDVVVGQTQRYMGFVQSELAEEGQQVRGVIIALEDSQRIRRALTVAPNIDFYLYRVNFDLEQQVIVS